MHWSLILASLSTISVLSGSIQVVSANNLDSQTFLPDILFQHPGFAPLPNLSDFRANSVESSDVLNLTNIQGNTLVGMTKLNEIFFFFGIKSVTDFKSKLASDIFPRITTMTQMLAKQVLPPAGFNVAFSKKGLDFLNVPSVTSDTDPFAQGQAADSDFLGDPPKEQNWIPGFIDTNSLHGVFIISSNTADGAQAGLLQLQSILGDSIVEIHRLDAQARPGDEQGHEHFGFLDGVSQPAVEGFAEPLPGQGSVHPGVILIGHQGDNVTDHPSWAKDGSFLVFRQLEQLVPEFNKFLVDNPVTAGVSTPEEGSALMGARMVGRWKSGAPIDISPLKDDPSLIDPMRINNFDFSDAADNSRCPLAAHIRKTNPRKGSDLGLDVIAPRRIVRAGITYGPEVSPSENTSNTTQTERGLAFVCYQSDISTGFRFEQVSWSNNENFIAPANAPPNSPFRSPGFDPIIGANHSHPRRVQGLNLADGTANITMMTDFIVSRGGEYFFSPPLSAIIDVIAK